MRANISNRIRNYTARMGSRPSYGWVLWVLLLGVAAMVLYKVKSFLFKYSAVSESAKIDEKNQVERVAEISAVATKAIATKQITKTKAYYLGVVDELQKALNPDLRSIYTFSAWDSIWNTPFESSFKILTGYYTKDYLQNVGGTHKNKFSSAEMQYIYSLFGIRDYYSGMFHMDHAPLDLLGFFHAVGSDAQDIYIDLLFKNVVKK